MDTFKDLGLSESILKALDDIGFETPTSIQKSAIGQLLTEARDLMGLAQTGTGKTAAFSLPLLDLMKEGEHYTQAVILAPTRELVQQIAVEIKNFSKYKKKINISTVYGGTNISTQIREIKKFPPHIIIATPGRLIDLKNRKVAKLDQIDYLILDEADEMLNMGFKEDIDIILEGTNTDKRTWLFSATMPKEIKSIVDGYMDDPIEVKVDQKSITNRNIEHKYVLVHRSNKAEAVKRVIDYISDFFGVIFCRTKMDTQMLAEKLIKDGYRAEALHGDLSQSQRDHVMNKFRAGSINILVATDVAARGIDVNDLTHVIHFTLPDSAAYYTHRSGRTARAGKKGVSLTILIPKDKGKMRQISKRLDIEFEKILLPQYAELLEKKLDRWTEKLLLSDQSDVPEDMVEKMMIHFENMDTRTLVSKLLAEEFRKIRKKSKNKEDLNLDEYSERSSKRREKSPGRRDRDRNRSRDRKRDFRDDRDGGRRGDRDRRDDRRSERRSDRRDDRKSDRRSDSKGDKKGKYDSKKKSAKMFINIGKVDKMTVGDLVDFISKNGNVKRKLIGDINMSKMHTTFELDKSAAKSVAKMFKNITFKGRGIRCNED